MDPQYDKPPISDILLSFLNFSLFAITFVKDLLKFFSTIFPVLDSDPNVA